MKKKILSTLLALIVVMSAITMPVYAAARQFTINFKHYGTNDSVNSSGFFTIERLFYNRPSNSYHFSASWEYNDNQSYTLYKVYDDSNIVGIQKTVLGSELNGCDLFCYYRPSIKTQPVDSTVAEGEPINLSISANNAVSYQWYKDNAEISGATSATYTKANAAVADGGIYYCVVKGEYIDTNTVTSNEVTLTVTPNVQSTISFNNPTIPSQEYDGKIKTLSRDLVTVTGSTGEVTFEYYSDSTCSTPAEPKNVGTYYVKAVVAEDDTYASAESTPVMFTITNTFNPVKGTEYTVSADGWTNENFYVTAKSGYKISLENTYNPDNWYDTLSKANETANGSLEFYVKNIDTGAISNKVTVNYKIDKTAPTIEGITDGATYYVDTKFTVNDNLSGIKSVTVNGIDVTADPQIAGDIKADNVEIVATDNAGNSTTVTVNTEEISSIRSAYTMFLSGNVTADQKPHLQRVKDLVDSIDMTNADIDDPQQLQKLQLEAINDDLNYLFKIIDDVQKSVDGILNDLATKDITAYNAKSTDTGSISTAVTNINSLLNGNNLSYEQRTQLTRKKALLEAAQKRISDVSTDMSNISNFLEVYDNALVNSSDKDDLNGYLTRIDNLLDGDNLTEGERNNLTENKAQIITLLGTLDTVTEVISYIKDKTKDITPENVKSSDNEFLGIVLEAAENLLNGDNLTADERTAVEGYKSNIENCLTQIDAVKEVIDYIKDKTKDITPENVKSSDNEFLGMVLEAAENLLNGDNLTADERTAVEGYKSNIENCLSVLQNAENVIKLISNLPEADKITEKDAEAVNKAKAAYDALTANGKKLVDKKYTDKLTKLLEAIKSKPVTVITDNPTGITVEGVDGTTFDSSTVLSVKPTTASDIQKNGIKLVANGKELVSLFDISLLKNGDKVSLDGKKVKVTITLTEEQLENYENFRIVYVDENGASTIIESSISGNKISFVTDHFSNYGVIADKKTTSKTDNAKTGDTSPILPMAGLAIASLSLLVILTKKKINR